MSKFDYIGNKAIENAITLHLRYIHNSEDREDFRQEIYAELYDVFPEIEEEAVRLVNRIAMKFRRGNEKIAEHEMGYVEGMGYGYW